MEPASSTDRSAWKPPRRAALVTVAALAAFAGVGYFVFAESARSYESVSEVARSLAGEGVRCDNGSFTENEVQGIDEVAYCTDPLGDYSILVFDDPNRAAKEVGWDFLPLRDTDPDTIDLFVVGPNWIVIARSREVAEAVQEAIGGDIHS